MRMNEKYSCEKYNKGRLINEYVTELFLEENPPTIEFNFKIKQPDFSSQNLSDYNIMNDRYLYLRFNNKEPINEILSVIKIILKSESEADHRVTLQFIIGKYGKHEDINILNNKHIRLIANMNKIVFYPGPCQIIIRNSDKTGTDIDGNNYNNSNNIIRFKNTLESYLSKNVI